MSLTIQCACDADICEISALNFVVQNLAMPYGDFWLRGGPTDPVIITASGTYHLTPVTAWLSAWNSLYVWINAQRSTSSDALDNFHGDFWIEATVSCSTTKVQARNSDTDLNECIIGGDYRAMASLGGGTFAGVIAHSRPLDDCYGFTISGGHFAPALNNVQIADVSSDDHICVCVSGGAPPYLYRISGGYPPGGVTFDMSTGCFEGTPDGSYAGSETIDITVTDANRPPLEATVTCEYIRCKPVVLDAVNVFY